ncbi:hypothetical protein [Streptomyces sp. NEAU-174]|uniref:hypothetical protein n=1 Tax=Streptomyces sp. NEAU-174 TaxID=3458254 RepID=UPI0040448A87
MRLAADESMTWARWAESSNVVDLTLAQLMGQTRFLAAEYLKPDSNPVDLFSRARHLRIRIFSLLEGHQHPHQASDLYLAGGYVCGLLAWISSDLGHTAEAEAQGLTAWLCAELSRNNTLRSWVLSVRSKTAFWDTLEGRHPARPPWSPLHPVRDGRCSARLPGGRRLVETRSHRRGSGRTRPRRYRPGLG